MIQRVVTSGTFTLGGATAEVVNNVWLIGDDREVLIVDAAHDGAAIAAAAGDRRVVCIACTHGHNDHVNAAPALSRRLGNVPVLLHPEDHMLWRLAHPDTPPPDCALADGDVLRVAGTALQVLHTPGHSPGSCCLYAPELKALFSGDTLLQGEPGDTSASYSDFDQIIISIRLRLLALPDETKVRPGHGACTTVAREIGHVSEWLRREV